MKKIIIVLLFMLHILFAQEYSAATPDFCINKIIDENIVVIDNGVVNKGAVVGGAKIVEIFKDLDLIQFEYKGSSFTRKIGNCIPGSIIIDGGHTKNIQGISYVLPAENIYEDWHQNPVSANNKYNGKVVRVTGRVGNIKDFDDKIQIQLCAKESLGVVAGVEKAFDTCNTILNCNFPKSQRSFVSQLKRRQTITVIGTYDVNPFFPRLINCEIK
jgi:hypothetical protein